MRIIVIKIMHTLLQILKIQLSFLIQLMQLQLLQQVQHLVGRTADPEFLEELREAASTYSERMQCDIVRAYHFGPRYLVELEMVMESSTPLRVSHDLALDLQQKIEAFDDVERCFVHVDYDFRDVDEHDPASWSPKINADRKVPNLV